MERGKEEAIRVSSRRPYYCEEKIMAKKRKRLPLKLQILLNSLVIQLANEFEKRYLESRKKSLLNPSFKASTKPVIFEERLREIKLTKEEKEKVWKKVSRRTKKWFEEGHQEIH